MSSRAPYIFRKIMLTLAVILLCMLAFSFLSTFARAETINTREALEEQISKLVQQVENQSSIEVANNTRLSVTVPAIVSMGETYKISWDDLQGPTLLRLAEAFPSAKGEIIAYSNNQSLGVAQTVAENISMQELLSGEMEWHVGSRTNDGRVLPSGTYTIALYISLPEEDEDDGGGPAIAQGNSSEFSIYAPTTIAQPSKNPEVERLLALLEQLVLLYRQILEKEQSGL